MNKFFVCFFLNCCSLVLETSVIWFVFFLVIVQANAKRNFEETFEAHIKLTPELRRTDLVCVLSFLSMIIFAKKKKQIQSHGYHHFVVVLSVQFYPTSRAVYHAPISSSDTSYFVTIIVFLFSCSSAEA